MSFLCPKCGQDCGEAEYRVHVENDCKTVRCPKCPQFYSSAEAVLRHTRAVHDREFQCTICQIDFASKYNLQRHQLCTHKQIYNEKKAQKCETCGEVVVGKYFLKRHIQKAHSTVLVCTVCSDEFASIYTLRRHMQRRHQDVAIGLDGQKINKVIKIDCPKCGKLIAKTSLERHLRIKHSKSFVCHVCERECPSEKALQKHIECRHGEEINEEVLLKKKFKCHICPRRFTAAWTLKTHIKAKHEGQFKCEVCDKLFSAPFPLMRHRSNIHGLDTEIESATIKSESTEEDSDTDEESENDFDLPSTSLEVKIEEGDERNDQKPDIEKIQEFKLKKEI